MMGWGGQGLERPHEACCRDDAGEVCSHGLRWPASRDAALLAIIVGDLWDYPPEEPLSTLRYRLHLAERYGEEVAAAWDRLSDPPETDGWALDPH